MANRPKRSKTFSSPNAHKVVVPKVSICSVEDDNNNLAPADPPNPTEEEEEEANNNNNNNNMASGKQCSSGVQTSMLPAMLGIAGAEAEEELKRALCQMDKRQLTLAQRRQSNMDVVHQASGRRTSTTLIPLTSAQIHLIRSLWRQVYLSKGPTVIGSQISHRLFFKEPQTREQFRRCPLPQQYVNHDSFSKAHCRQVSEMIDQVVESLDDLESVSQMLEHIGRAHARISGGQLSSKLWNSVAETFIDCTLEWGDRRARSETVRKAWALIIAFMIERIKHGHLEERRQITAIRSTIASLERFAVGGTSSTPTLSNGPNGNVSGGNCNDQNSSAKQSPSIQLSLPTCPIRRVSAVALNGPNRPVKFSPDQFRSPNPNSSSAFPSASRTTTTSTSMVASIVSPVANRRKPLLRIHQQSPKTGPLSNRTRSDAERPKGWHSRKGSAEVNVSTIEGSGDFGGGGGGGNNSGAVNSQQIAAAAEGIQQKEHTDV